MYKLLLILRYLRRKLAPMFAALAVTLCTAMVIIVISVMGGFLEMMRASARTLTGDLTVWSDLAGFPHYEELIAELRQLPEVAGATAVLRTYGLINLDGRISTVEVVGIRPSELDKVTGYRSTLYWSRDRLRAELDREERLSNLPSPDQRTRGQQELVEAYRQRWQRDAVEYGMALRPPADWIDPLRLGHEPNQELSQSQRGIVIGIEVNPYNYRDESGQYRRPNSALTNQVTLTLLPITQRGAVQDPAVRQLTVVNEFKSGLYEVDANRVYVPFDLMQQMLRMDPAQEADPETGQPTGQIVPGRASEVIIRNAPGVPLEVAHEKVFNRVREFVAQHPGMPGLIVHTWEQRHATLLNAVEKEKGLLTILFAIISVVAVAMIGVIFYMIVLEKTRDIGTLRAVGASRLGIASIFLGYGLAIGVVGSMLGLAVGASIVWNLNPIQDFLYQVFGFKMWDPRIYYFDRIPSSVDPVEVSVIVVAAICSSVLGSVVPAFLAGRLNPVEALRYE